MSIMENPFLRKSPFISTQKYQTQSFQHKKSYFTPSLNSLTTSSIIFQSNFRKYDTLRDNYSSLNQERKNHSNKENIYETKKKKKIENPFHRKNLLIYLQDDQLELLETSLHINKQSDRKTAETVEFSPKSESRHSAQTPKKTHVEILNDVQEPERDIEKVTFSCEGDRGLSSSRKVSTKRSMEGKSEIKNVIKSQISGRADVGHREQQQQILFRSKQYHRVLMKMRSH